MQGPECRSKVDVAGTGFTVLDRIYADGGLADEALGGSCGNVLVSLAMLHRRVAPLLALGDDDTGEMLVDEFVRAGATTKYISRRRDLRSPILAQELDTRSGRHDFSFVCPETREDFPPFQSVGEIEVSHALPMLTCCSIFYTDRLSESILTAMRVAASAGAVIFFEPSECDDRGQFDEAVRLATILKYSGDRLGHCVHGQMPDCVRIVTHGAAGLEVRDGTASIWCDALAAPKVLDTCGSGDMVSVGLIDWMLTQGSVRTRLRGADILAGIVAGQRLAAENCGYTGARGLFKARGAGYVRQLLDACTTQT